LRDPRIEFLRGLALYMIVVDHVSGDPLAMFTYRILGFSDAAEMFVPRETCRPVLWLIYF